MEMIPSSETLILTRATWHHIPVDDILHSHRRENFKSYKYGVVCLRGIQWGLVPIIFKVTETVWNNLKTGSQQACGDGMKDQSYNVGILIQDVCFMEM
jgi:hypothetical protein